MRPSSPFRALDLRELDERLLSRADEVVAMREIAAGERDPLVIGLRHDVDNTFDKCVALAAWESDRGYRATYFVLHDSPYWDDPNLRPALEQIVLMGHEVGIHCNALAEAFRTGEDPVDILYAAVARLSAWGHRVTGVVAHGDPACYHRDGTLRFVNDELFTECARPEMGEPDRFVTERLKLNPVPLSYFGFEYESYRAGPRHLYLSDSGGEWNEPFYGMCDQFPSAFGQLHVLMHPCWWTQAFSTEGVAA